MSADIESAESTAQGDVPLDNGEWRCIFCKTAKFDTHDKAVEHELDCEERTVIIHLEHEPKKKLGLVFVNQSGSEGEGSGKERTFVTISGQSPTFDDNITAIQAVAGALFPLDAAYVVRSLEESVGESSDEESDENSDGNDVDNAEESDDENGVDGNDEERFERNGGDGNNEPCDVLIDGLKEFSRKHLRYLATAKTRHQFGSINHTSLKAMLAGKIQPGDIIQKVEYTVQSKMKALCLDKGSQAVSKLLSRKNYYPIELTIQRRPPKPTTQLCNHDHWYGLQKMDLSECGLLLWGRHWEHFSNGLCKLHLLSELTLDRNRIGREGCVALGPFLKLKNSSLKFLSLRGNLIDDECVSVLSAALQNNIQLKTLILEGNEITNIGWEFVLNLVLDKTSIEGTYLSNHTLKDVGVELVCTRMNRASFFSRISSTCENIRLHLASMLHYNARGSTRLPAAVRKIRHVHLNRRDFDLQPFVDLDVKVMPHVLAWFAGKSSSHKGHCVGNLHRLIRNWNIPTLLGYPSVSKSRMIELETKSAGLEVLISRLKAENANLKEERGAAARNIEQLKAETKAAGNENSKLREEIRVLKGQEEATERMKRSTTTTTTTTTITTTTTGGPTTTTTATTTTEEPEAIEPANPQPSKRMKRS